MRKKIRKLSFNFLLITTMLVITQLVFSLTKGPHEEWISSDACLDCHSERPEMKPREIYTYRNVPLKTDITEMCTECHEYGERSHPTDMAVDFEVPVDLPLRNGKVTCVTCHYPHGSPESDQKYVSSNALSKLGSFVVKKKKYKTYYLRRLNTKGRLCLTCHKK